MSAPYFGLKSIPFLGLKGKSLYEVLLQNQEYWIDYCEKNGRSYTGSNGAAIRQADLNELYRIRRILRDYKR